MLNILFKEKAVCYIFPKKSNGFFYKIFILIIISNFQIFPQETKTNLEVYYSLIDSSISLIKEKYNEINRPISLRISLPEGFNHFENNIKNSFSEKFNGLIKTSDNFIVYSLDELKVEYGKPYKTGIFGKHKTERKISISGSYSFEIEDIKVEKFNINFVDTVFVNEIPQLENYSFPFTQNEIPEESFFGSITEPFIVISAAAAAIILFFTVRSN